MPDSRKTNRQSQRGRTVDEHAHAIADAVDTAWHRAHGYGHLEVPLSVIAALAFLAPPFNQRGAVAVEISGMESAAFAAFMRRQWRGFVTLRPDLLNPAAPLLLVWHGEHPITGTTLDAARGAARAALQAGQLHLTGDRETRWQVDLFGVLLTLMKGRNAKGAHGQFYTPSPLAHLMAAMLGIAAGETIHEPAAGTGGMLRAAAQVMREADRDPATATWVANDIDPLAVACLAVNAVLWELGPRVVIGVGDTLSDEWITRALAERAETIQIASDMRRLQQMRHAFGLLQRRTDSTAHQQPDEGGEVA
ncbi:N-6 DNA methylase [Murinocardiopsis flavida]|uniref:site-specific DNA-methyltransferase (adenine-specific) n=1 Tax=Murinocardiopsis flavida TaxID=645275 RepID=A0A2P8CY98_9ACTN|nr:N-6 DNA methylase [Murinocardiopsis flavida]PSK89950.1 N-6 DNA methylase [Murinocardiopsis flavida]